MTWLRKHGLMANNKNSLNHSSKYSITKKSLWISSKSDLGQDNQSLAIIEPKSSSSPSSIKISENISQGTSESASHLSSINHHERLSDSRQQINGNCSERFPITTASQSTIDTIANTIKQQTNQAKLVSDVIVVDADSKQSFETSDINTTTMSREMMEPKFIHSNHINDCK